MSSYVYSCHVEKDLLHPAVAHMLNARGDDWSYEYTVAGSRRVDFIEHSDGVVSLIECKMKLKPTPDIEQLGLYHKLYGNPTARKVLITPKRFYSDAKLARYTANDIEVRFIEGNFTVAYARHLILSSQRRRVHDLYPDHCYKPNDGTRPLIGGAR